MKNTFITIEGIEGAGKTTIAKRTAAWLQNKGMDCLYTREPGGTPAGEKIRDVVLNPHIQLTAESELLLFEAARRQMMAQVILPALEKGKTVVLDRFIDSTVAYQGYGRQIDLEWIQKLNAFACIGRYPDITILLDIDVQTGLKRAKQVSSFGDRFETETTVFMENVRQGFLTLAKTESRRISVVSVKPTTDETWEQIEPILQDRVC